MSTKRGEKFFSHFSGGEQKGEQLTFYSIFSGGKKYAGCYDSTIYNEKPGPKLTKNQKHCKFTLLALARKLTLITIFSKWENRFIY